MSTNMCEGQKRGLCYLNHTDKVLGGVLLVLCVLFACAYCWRAPPNDPVFILCKVLNTGYIDVYI